MDKDAILDFLKKNAFALSCGVVALVAAGSVFVYPFGGLVEQLHAKAETGAGQYSNLASMTKRRTLPLVDATQPTAGDLTQFPNPAQVAVGDAAVKQLTAQSLAAMNALVAVNDLTVHKPLVGDVLPNPLSDTPKFTFADVYKRALSTDPTMSGIGTANPAAAAAGTPSVPPPIQANPTPTEPMVADDHLAAQHAVNLCNDVLRAGSPPDAKLIREREEWLRTNVFEPKIILSDGKPVNSPEVLKEFEEARKLVPDQLAREIAQSSRVYLDHDAFGLNPNLVTASNPQLTDIWFAQMALWVQTDMATAVAALNHDSRGVGESTVKRILRLDMGSGPAMYRYPRESAGGGLGGAGGVPAAADETSALPVEFAASPTGRVSNKMYDVIPFHLVLDVRADRVDDVIAGLTKDRLIYVYNQDLYTVDPAPLATQNYLYGTGPIVRLTLVGEELFLRRWTAPLMPPRIKQLLGLEAATAAPLGGAPTPDRSNGE